jgi:hypothetical protein
MGWGYAPDLGGTKISERTKLDVQYRLEQYAEKHYAGKYTRLDVRFRDVFCYVGAFVEPETGGGTIGGETVSERRERLRNTPIRLCRLRHFTAERWTMGFFKYSDEKYELCFVDEAGGFECTPEQGFDVAARAYLSDR